MVRALPCGDYVSFQVLLDRQGFSSGQIDGKPGNNFNHALSAAQAVCAALEASAAQGRWVAVTEVTGAPPSAR